MASRVLEGENQVTQKYKKGTHNGIDLIKKTGSSSYITAHSDGEVVGVVTNIDWTKYGSGSYGNYVKIKHDNGYYTMYAHLKYGSVTVSKGTKVLKGERLGYMGATGSATGVHLHFEVRDTSDTKIDPTDYIDSDLPNSETTTETGAETGSETTTKTTHKVVRGDTISGICVTYYGKYTQNLGNKIVEANKSTYPKITLDYIQAGWTLVIPEV